LGSVRTAKKRGVPGNVNAWGGERRKRSKICVIPSDTLFRGSNSNKRGDAVVRSPPATEKEGDRTRTKP